MAAGQGAEASATPPPLAPELWQRVIVLFPSGDLIFDQGSLSVADVTVQTGGGFSWSNGMFMVDEFNGSLTNGGGVLATRPGSNTITITGEYLQQEGATLSIEIAGDAASGQFDKLTVGNSAFLGGTLEVELAETFEPSPADVYTVIDALNFGAGSFDNVANGERLFLEFSGGSFLVNYGVGSPFDPSQVVLSDFQPALSADFDDDRDVDGDDLAQWQGDFGVNGLSDADGDGDSDGADFLAWQQQLGSVPAVPAVGAVPEPSVIVLAAIGMTVPAVLRGKRQR